VRAWMHHWWPEVTTQFLSNSHLIQGLSWLACLSNNIDKWYLCDNLHAKGGKMGQHDPFWSNSSVTRKKQTKSGWSVKQKRTNNHNLPCTGRVNWLSRARLSCHFYFFLIFFLTLLICFQNFQSFLFLKFVYIYI